MDDEQAERRFEALLAQIQLRENESLRLLRSAGRLVTLERTDPQASAVPWDRDLVLSADVRAFPLADLLRLIHTAGKSGFVLFANEAQEKGIYLSRGEVVFASSNQKVDRLGESLLRSGTITLEQLRRADERFGPGMRIGKVLVELGILTPRDLWTAVKQQVEDIVRSLFAHTTGTLHFWEGEVQPDNIVRLALPTRRLIAEGLKRRDELFRFLAVLEDDRTRLRAVPALRDRLGGNELALVDALAEEDRFPALCRRIGMDPLSGARTVQLMKLVGAIELVRREGVPRAAPRVDPRIQEEERIRAAVLDYTKLLAELSAPLVAVDGAARVEERLQEVVVEAASRHPAILGQLVVGTGGGIDPDGLTERVLRLPQGRLRALSDAMDEVITYLEFELQNHPRIEDPEVFLQAVEGLRASLDL